MLTDSVPLIGAGVVAGSEIVAVDVDGNNCQLSGKQCLTGQGILIGILDTGVDYTHPMFGSCTLAQITDTDPNTCSKIHSGFDFYDSKDNNNDGDYDDVGDIRDTDPMDIDGHGTHVASTSAGKNTLLPDGRSIAGVARDATIYAYKVFGLKNGVIDGNTGHVIAAIARAVDLDQDKNIGPAEDADGDPQIAKADRLDVIVLSLGGEGHADDPISQAIDNAVSNDVVAVVAAGNEGPDPETVGSPGTARKALTVGSTCDKFYTWPDPRDPLKTVRKCVLGSDALSKFSSRGPAPGGTIKPDVTAPGELITAAWPQSVPCDEVVKGSILQSPPGYCTIQGTSMATPHVGGVAALLRQKNPTWHAEQIKAAIKITAKNLALPENEQGTGRVSVARALQLAEPPVVSLKLEPELKGVVSLTDPLRKNEMKGSNVQTFTLSRVPRSSPTSTPTVVTNDINIQSLDTTSISDGEYFFTATVTGNGLTYSDKALVKINNVPDITDIIPITITQPEDKAVLLAGAPILVVGNGYTSGTMTLEFGRASPLTSVSTVTQSGTSFGTIATSSITEEGFYTIKAKNAQTTGTSEAIVTVYIVPPQKCVHGQFFLGPDGLERCNCENGQCAKGTCTGAECATKKRIIIDTTNGLAISFGGKTITASSTSKFVDLPVGSRHVLRAGTLSGIQFEPDHFEPDLPNSVLTITSDKTYKPFWKVLQQQLTVGSNPAGSGSFNLPTTTWQDVGSTVQLSVEFAKTSTFVEWQDCTVFTCDKTVSPPVCRCACLGKTPLVSLTMNAQPARERSVVAVFTPNTGVCQ